MGLILTIPTYQLCLLAAYSIILLGGGVANSLLLWMVNETAGIRNKNPLLGGLFICDIIVCLITAPISICMLGFDKYWSLRYDVLCKLGFYIEEIPSFASTIIMMLLSLDRWLNIKFPQPAGTYYLRRRIVTAATVACWLISFLVNIPIPLTREVVLLEDDIYQCVETWHSDTLYKLFILFQLFFGYIIPCSVTMICHLGIRASLDRVSLSTRVAHGELPLPFPFMRDADNMPILIVGLRTKVASKEPEPDENGDVNVENGENIVTYHRPSCSFHGDDETTKVQLVETSFSTKRHNRMVMQLKHKRGGTLERCRRLRQEEAARQSGKKVHSKIETLNETIKNRKRTSKQLVTYGTIICFCWFPYVCCTFYGGFSNTKSETLTIITQYALLIGHAHSAINPLFYYLMNRKTLSTVKFPCFKFFRNMTTRRSTLRNNASSTNEAALGPFDPRLVRPPSQRNRRTRPVRRLSSLDDLFVV